MVALLLIAALLVDKEEAALANAPFTATAAGVDEEATAAVLLNAMAGEDAAAVVELGTTADDETAAVVGLVATVEEETAAVVELDAMVDEGTIADEDEAAATADEEATPVTSLAPLIPLLLNATPRVFFM